MTVITINLRRLADAQPLFTILDEADAEYVMGDKWYAVDQPAAAARYVKGRNGKRPVYMHREILGITDTNTRVEHINGNRLDNRRSNLRIVIKGRRYVAENSDDQR